MDNTPFPKVPESQIINNIAKEIFNSQKPSNWHVIDIDGDNDFGLDFLIQYRDQSRIIKYNFFVQLKGTMSEQNITQNEIKIPMKASTLNYYRNNGLVLVIVCDLNIQQCYYKFHHIILNGLNENKRYLSDVQETYQITISKEQIITKELNLENILESYAHGIYDVHRRLTIVEESNIKEFFADTEKDYQPKRNIYNNNFLHQKGRVYVEAFIPNDYDFSISCLITFRLSDAKNALITSNEKIILKDLFSGYKSKANSHARKWVICNLKDEFIIQIGNTRLSVPPQTLIDLSDIMDDLFEVYTSRIIDFEKQLKANFFPISKVYTDGFKLASVPRNLWHFMHKFAEKHNFHGNGEWDIFGNDQYYLRVNFADSPFIWSGNIIIAPERYDGYTDYKQVDNSIVLTWCSLPNEKYERKDSINKIYDVERAHDWLLNKFIPYVIYDLEINKIKEANHNLSRISKIFKREKNIPTFEEFLLNYKASKYGIYDYKDNCFHEMNKDFLLHIVNKLQSFYRNQKNIFIDTTKLTSLYNGLKLLFENSSTCDLSYLYGNLNDLILKNNNLTKENIIDAIENKIKSLETGTTNEFRIDLILRCYIVLIEDDYSTYEEKFINEILNILKDIIQLMSLLETRERQLKRFFT